MKLLVLLSVVALLSAQVHTVSITPHSETSLESLTPSTPSRHAIAGGLPILGYMLGTAPTDLHAIFATGQAPTLSPSLPVPAGSQRLYLPPRQQYALVELNTGAPMAVWNLHREVSRGEQRELISLTGTMSHPDLISFSPRGDAAALYSRTAATIQLLSQFPLKPAIIREFSLQHSALISRIAISDDAEVVVAQFSDGSLAVSSMDDNWQTLHIAYTPQAWSFVPRTHDLVMSDYEQKTIVIQSRVDAKASSSRILAQSMVADQLSVSKDGAELLAANSTAGQVSRIDLKSGTITPASGISKVAELSLLRDGFTYVLSTAPTLSLLTLGGRGDLPDAAQRSNSEPATSK